MVELSSRAKPRGDAEAAAVKFRRRVVDGSPGEADTERSRASAAFLRVGKSDTPVSRRFAPGTGALETVIGIDDRQRVLETELHPWRMICGLELFGPTGAAIGTGWFVGPRTLLTAGHCVHDQSFFGGWADRIVVSPGRNDFDFPFGQAEATRFSALDRWVDTADPNFDIGCIHLDEDLGSSTGWFAFGTLTPEELDSHLVNISGYPGDRGSGRQQYFHANRILHVGDRRVFYDVDTFGGQSGSPVWIHEEEGAAPLAVAIHAYGTGGTPFDLGITANSAPRFIPEVFDIITEWIAEDSPAAQTG